MFLLVGALIALSPPSAQSQNGAVSDSALSTLETAYDFGTISMASGKVTVLFNINNAVSSPLTVRKLYTSCMCTSATLLLADRRVGPFSMEGHGSPVPTINEELPAGQEAQIEVVFDPAAHGPAGVGPISRNVFVETTDGKKLVFEIKAQVTP
ncbi:MAG: hypothetical protein A2429_00545 [Candidatus Veblenbacteria bacterium RIFOXYC1_FULL_42_9]|uniref:DUF1573 domain-containing protein n=4 Tax=Candidatus Vebleniibacteriota TaxID=1817921 RepID=A0A1G2Q2X6_9BACT|nr:MAG: hypothetical protein A2429_00545 [Candidatus Veblenbacteria bacterium RIFOXYC1_FULL_42_9]OHA55298.1 MAG: hypothetical protein A2226_03675 [Candidatus Veblenbacteria bacterium RIFOXYA2_FULL_43_9]OHA55403.1 MAG: hypothetical protein A2388_00695 [Candidatus Veblenbacteria bacterium RIFOXYB1_FULL_43_13]OHA56240.1 MAG: hypothetical protein A2588_02325 [Candidatus Veblenbacteria bacterium RIFOXYD1_FULL_43_11]